MTLGAFLSSSTAGFFAAYLGRRQCLWLASLLCIVSNVVMMTTTNLVGLYAGRLLIGLANGWYMTFSQLYIQVLSRPLKMPFAIVLCLWMLNLWYNGDRKVHQRATAAS